ncbi:MAG: hypothetical protein MUO50_14025 [Longimicrobiales bacterium]|nr:hypothetical protein [Longimicrobiales bacterium]
MNRVLSMMALFVCLLPTGAGAQTAGKLEWFPGGTYDSSIPTPASFLGYEIGFDFTPHHRLKAYLEAVAAASDRVSLGSYGATNEGRDLMLLTVTSPANHARLEEIRLNMGRLADPRGADQSELDAIIQGSPAVAWLSYNVHGSESAGTEAAILTVYQLAAGTDAGTQAILDEVVVIIDPLSNPDGRERVVQSFQKRRGMTFSDNPDSWEHGSDWPGGRANHYFFDLNRDWSWQTQVETQQRTVEYLRWNPVVHVDFHEMGGDSYFFFPAATPVHKAIPDVVMKWQQIFGEGNAMAFDRFGWPYYTKIGFDMYYPGFGDSWPSMLGAIGMTYEQGGGSGVGIAVKRDDGTTHSLRQRAHGHFTASMATLKTVAEKREERLTDFLAFFRHAIGLGNGPVKSYALVPGTDPYNADRLAKLLTRQGIEVTSASEDFNARVGRGFGVHPAPSSKAFPAGTYLVAAGQPKGVAVQMLMEPEPLLEDTSFYDLSGWALPLVYNVEAYMLSEIPGVASVPVSSLPRREGGLEGGRGEYAYAISYQGTSALLAAVELLNRGIIVKVAEDGFTVHGREYPAGSFLIPVYRNPENLNQTVDEVAGANGVRAYPINTGLVEEGDDLGAGSYRQLKKPRIAIAAGEAAGSGFGEVWNFFDQGYPFFDYANVDASRLGSMDLSDYDVLILPGGNFGSVFNEQGVERLRGWMQGGGMVIGFEGGAQFLTQQGSKLTSVTDGAPEDEEDEKDKDESAVEARKTLAEREQESKEGETPGGFYKVVLDPDHWMAFGLPEEMAVLKRGDRGFGITDRGVNVAVFSEESLLSGYAPSDFEEKLSKKSWLIVESVGRGQAVLFADNPLYRMFLESEHQMVLNAIVLGTAFQGGGRGGN